MKQPKVTIQDHFPSLPHQCCQCFYCFSHAFTPIITLWPPPLAAHCFQHLSWSTAFPIYINCMCAQRRLRSVCADCDSRSLITIFAGHAVDSKGYNRLQADSKYAGWCEYSLGIQAGPQVIKLFSCPAQLSMKFSLRINMKVPTIVGIFILICRENFMLSYV